MKNKHTATFSIVLVLVLVGLGLLIYPNFQSGPTNLGPFAACLKDKGALFYGTFWCLYCQAQKKLFGSAAGELPYIECSTPDGQGQLPVCAQNGIKGYPTWAFADGSRLSGEVPLRTLADKSGCVLPEPQ